MPRRIDYERALALLAEHGGNCAAVARIMQVHENSIGAIARRARGECLRCKAPVKTGKTECAKCLDEGRKRVKERRKKRRHDGVCIDCGEARMLGSRYYCAKHRRAAIARNAAYEKRKGVMNATQKKRRVLQVYGPAGWEAWQRAQGRCEICSAAYGEITVHIHHIDQDRSNNALENFACLCFDCHRAVHRLLASKDRKRLIAWFETNYPDQALR